VVLRPQRSEVVRQALLALPIGTVGAVIAYGAGSAGKPIGVLIGVPVVGLAAFMLLNRLTLRVRLADGVLTARSLFEKHSIAVSDIRALVPVELAIEFTSWPNRLLNNRWPKARFLDVRTDHTSTGIWLNPRVYGVKGIQALVDRLELEPEREVDRQTMWVSNTGRTVWPKSAVEASKGRLRRVRSPTDKT
jgi:hypothetical protein